MTKNPSSRNQTKPTIPLSRNLPVKTTNRHKQTQDIVTADNASEKSREPQSAVWKPTYAIKKEAGRADLKFLFRILPETRSEGRRRAIGGRARGLVQLSPRPRTREHASDAMRGELQEAQHQKKKPGEQLGFLDGHRHKKKRSEKRILEKRISSLPLYIKAALPSLLCRLPSDI